MSLLMTEMYVWLMVGMLQMLMSLETGLRTSDHGDTVIVPVLAFRLEPDPSVPPGLLTVDGECVDYGPIPVSYTHLTLPTNREV